MLVLTRRVGERIRVGIPPNEVWMTVTEINGKSVKLGFAPDKGVRVDREELAVKRDAGERR